VRTEPGTSLALCLGDLPSGHFDRDLGPALLATRAARQGREVEPLMCFDEIDRNAPTAGRISYAKFEQGIDISALGIGETAADQELRTLVTNCAHLICSPVLVSRTSGRDGKEMVNAAVTSESQVDGDVVDESRATDDGRRNEAHRTASAVERLERQGVDQSDIIDAGEACGSQALLSLGK